MILRILINLSPIPRIELPACTSRSAVHVTSGRRVTTAFSSLMNLLRCDVIRLALCRPYQDHAYILLDSRGDLLRTHSEIDDFDNKKIT